MSELSEIKGLAGYLDAYGKVLSSKAIHSLSPLHVPGRDPLPAFDYVPEHRTPFEAQSNLVAASIKMLDANGAGFIIGEPGVGKTLSAILAIHEHAARGRGKGGRGGKYRSIVICPDHLISKWKNEIEDTIPGVVVHCWRPDDEVGSGITLDKWWDFLKLMTLGRTETKIRDGDQPEGEAVVASVSTGSETIADHDGDNAERMFYFEDRPIQPNTTAGKVIQYRKVWIKPRGPEWIVLGRDQIKRQPEWLGLGQPRRGYDGKTFGNWPHSIVVTDRKPVTGPDGNHLTGRDGRLVLKAIVEKRICCPRCGHVPLKKGVAIGMAELDKSTQHTCKGMILEEVGEKERKGDGLDRIYQNPESSSYRGGTRPGIPHELRNATPGAIVNHAGKRWRVATCGEPLYSWTSKPRWWPAANVVQRKLHRIARYLIVDECHEQKSDESAQSLAMGKILGSTQYCLAMTGTFIGGYASHLYPLLMRMAARDMTSRQFEWGKEMDFVARYGCIDRIVRSETPVESERTKGTRSMRKTKQGGTRVEKRCRPGIMPTLFSEIVMPLAMFLKLEQFVDGLPGFEEKMIACDLPPDIQAAYNATADILAATNRELIANGNPKLLGTMLWTLLSYPDHPWGWEPMFRGDEPEHDTHSVGWWRTPKLWTRENFVGVVSPQNFDADTILPKERALIELCKAHQEGGDQTWVYCEMTQKRDVMGRLARLLEAEGLKVGIMRSGDVSPKEREVWIQRNGYLFDVMLSHPQLVATGLDLFSVQHGNHNFNHLVFYQTGYNLFRLRQASRRAWRIGQPKDCSVTYLYYSGTTQAAAMALMGRKAQAAQQLEEGNVSDEGLAAMGGDAGAQAALVKTLGEHIDPAEIHRNWSKVKSRGDMAGKRASSAGPAAARSRPGISPPVPAELYEREHIPPPGVASPFDRLPIASQIVAEATVKAGDRSVDDALADFKAWLAGEAARASRPVLRVVGVTLGDDLFEDGKQVCIPHFEEVDESRAEILQAEADVPAPSEAFGRDELAGMLNKLRSGELAPGNPDDEWDW